MKKFLISLVLACGLAAPVFAQVPPTTVLAGPATADAFVYTAPNGHTVPYDIVFTASGIDYAVFDPTVSYADFTAAYSFLQSTQASTETNGAKVLPLVVAGFVNTSIGSQVVRMTSAVTLVSSTTLQTLPQLQAVVQTGNNYTFRAVLYTSTGAGGIKIDFGGTAVPVSQSVMAQVTSFGGTTIPFSSQITGFLTGPPGSAASGTTQVIIEGTFQVNTGGTFVIQFAQSSSSAAPTIVEYGSTLTVTQVP